MNFTTHDKFNSADADLIIISSDYVKFRLHRMNLASYSEGFPGAEVGTAGEEVHLTEPSSVLEVLFLFIYPEHHQQVDLGQLVRKGRSMLALAEAVEKYQVTGAFNHCMKFLRQPKFVHRYPLDVLAHALRHGYPALANAAAVLLYLCEPKDIIERLTDHGAYLWLKYRERCRDTIFKVAEDYLENMQITKYCITIKAPFQVCSVCRTCLLTWFTYLQTISSELKLLRELATLESYPTNINHTFCGSECMYGNRCDHALQMAKMCGEGLREITKQPFVVDPKAEDPQARKLPLVELD
ncbi:hypothetical protein CPB83DRAFT_818541 [Crepidotus variabilis]|uniref:BTB domain-containing protein n=1 Tax=Crepidotus variabilis TaxID=179855 RepID=A0A9P6JLK4_9AGAR|nr:hypothetical protein CPB83DRAFT_818541 [Crepidotus variabilis]